MSARKKNRPTGKDYLEHLFPDFQELHGDRLFADDQALIGGIATFGGIPVTVLVQEKGTSTKESISHNFGMCSPEGYRKALRLMKQAEKFHRPVICLVDTPGAFCGIEAENGAGRSDSRKSARTGRFKNSGIVGFDRRRRKWWSIGAGGGK